MIRRIRAAFAFLTRLPVGGHPFSADEIRGCSAHFPLVGLALGAILATLLALLEPFGPWLASCFTVGFSLVLTVAFHEDGLADTADALGGGSTPERIFEILKDSRIGTFGSAALTISLLARVLLLVEIGPAASAPLILIEGVSRAPPVVTLSLVPYATPAGTSKSRDVARGSGVEGWLAVGWAALALSIAVLAGVVSFLGAITLALLASGVTLVSVRYFIRRVGGITGDFLGAMQQIVALTLWLAWTLP